MATTMNTHSRDGAPYRTTVQKVCIGLGIVFVLAGLLGMIIPGFLGLHLSMTHNVIHLASGVLAIWAGYSDNPRKAFTFALAFGVVYGLLGVLGFVFGTESFSNMPHVGADRNLFRVIPGALVLGTEDHVLHIILSVIFIGGALASREQVRVSGRRDVFTGTNDRVPNSESGLRDASLGRSDINRPVDVNRRSDFERRV